MAVENQSPRRGSFLDSLSSLLLIAAIVAMIVTLFGHQIGTFIAPLLGYATTTIERIPPQALPNAAPQPAVDDLQQRLDRLYATPVLAVDPTDVAASQISEPDDYTEITKPATHLLPTLAPVVVQQAAPQKSDESPAVVNEGSKPARHRP
jgi:hypothetical protein